MSFSAGSELQQHLWRLDVFIPHIALSAKLPVVESQLHIAANRVLELHPADLAAEKVAGAIRPTDDQTRGGSEQIFVS